jgi:Xaa-Pro dipeptidase
MDLDAIQQALAEQELDGWLLFDFHGANPIARRLLGLRGEGMSTRRWFYLIPRSGGPVAILHAIEPKVLGDVTGRRRLYRSWKELAAALAASLGGLRRVAMEYSPGGAIPHVSRVDAGTVELVRAAGVEVVSSADLIQLFDARWSARQKEMHDQAAARVLRIKDEAFALVRERLLAGAPIRESELQSFVLARFSHQGLVTDHPCIVAVDEHASDPHFETQTGADDREIASGRLLLLDLWAKLAEDPDAVYYDTTWMAYCGASVPQDIQNVWTIVRDARDAAIAAIVDARRQGRPIRGCDVDDAARGFISARGFGAYFPHRTGHSIGTEVHGNGVNMDNLETCDQRTLVPGLAFSIEPGIYLPKFGVRSEVDVYLDVEGVHVTGASQRDLVVIA